MTIKEAEGLARDKALANFLTHNHWEFTKASNNEHFLLVKNEFSYIICRESFCFDDLLRAQYAYGMHVNSKMNAAAKKEKANG